MMKKYKHNFRCICIVILSIAMLTNGYTIIKATEKKVVAGFHEITEKVYTVTDTDEESLDFPDSLIATVYDDTNESKTETIENVTWTCKEGYHKNQEGDYIFNAVLPQEYTLKEDVVLPTITVTVDKEKEESQDIKPESSSNFSFISYSNTPSLLGAESTENDFLFSQETGTITGLNMDTSVSKDIVIPVTINGNYVLHIGDDAFAGQQLTSVTFATGSKVESIGNRAFYNNSSIQNITIPDTVKTIGTYAFKNTGIKELTLPGSMETIPNSLFQGYTQFETLTLKEGVKTIGNSAFEGCSELKIIDLPGSLTSIGNNAFKGNNALTSLTFHDLSSNSTIINSSVFQGCSSLETLSLPSNVKVIGSSAFRDCTSLNTVTLSSKLETIESDAFRNTAIGSITIPETVTSIKDNAFIDCKKLIKVEINGTSTINIAANAFYNNDANLKRTIAFLGRSENDLTNMPWGDNYATFSFNGKEAAPVLLVDSDYTFNRLTNTITKYEGTANTISIPKYFSHDDQQYEVHIIDSGVFQNNQTITGVTIPDTVTEIKDNAFIYLIVYRR